MMPNLPVDQPPTSPSLLPSVLQSLPDLPTNPTLAYAVFEAVRKASRRVVSLRRVSPLLAPITPVALSAELPQVRDEAACTCVTLVSCLVSRGYSKLASAYVADLAATARVIIQHDNPQPITSFLSKFLATARSAAPEQDKRVFDAVRVPEVAVAPESLQALLDLLASLVLMGDCTSSPAKNTSLSTEMPVEYLSGGEESSQSAAVSLWRCLGGATRASVLDLAASHAILSGRCGTKVMLAASSILERAFDVRSGCCVPDPVRRRVACVVHHILAQETSIKSTDFDYARCSLYKLARICAPQGQLPASLWIVSGIRDAVNHRGELGRILRQWSHNSLVARGGRGNGLHASSGRTSTLSERELEPPLKKRRVDMAEKPPAPTSSQLECSQKEQSQYPSIPEEEARKSPTSALTRELQQLEDISTFAEKPEAVFILGRVASVTSDSLTATSKADTASLSDNAEWIGFARSISLIIRDVLTNVRRDIKMEMWDAIFFVATESLRLISALLEVGEGSSHGHTSEDGTEEISPGSNLLISSVLSVLNTASLELDSKGGQGVPMKSLSSLLCYFGNFMERPHFSLPERSGLTKAIERFENLSIDGMGEVEATDTALLMRNSFRVGVRMREPVLLGGAQENSRLSSIISQNMISCPELAAAALFVKSTMICASAGCKGVYCIAREDGTRTGVERTRADTALWVTIFREVSDIAKGSAGEVLLIAAVRCLGTLAYHCPSTKVGEATAALVQALWHPTCQAARTAAMSSFSLLLVMQPEDVVSGPASEMPEGHRERIPFSSQDALDTTDAVFKPRGDEHDPARLLGVELLGHVKTINEILRQRDMTKLEAVNFRPLILLMELPPDGYVTSKVIGLVCDTLVACAMAELVSWRSTTIQQLRSERYSQVEERVTTFKCNAWNAFLTCVLQLRFGRFSRQANPRLPSSSFMRFSGITTILSGQSPLGSHIADFLNSRMSEWLPFTFQRLTSDDSAASQLAQLLMVSDAASMWKKFPRHILGWLIRRKDKVGLECLAHRVGQPTRDLVVSACADVFAREALLHSEGLDLSPSGPSGLIQETLQTPLESILFSQLGKVVQRILRENGSCNGGRVKSALESISLISVAHGFTNLNSPGALVSAHFMLVMDAVNRGLFHPNTTDAERVRYLRMLDGVIDIARGCLHMYIPKMLATLKMAIDRIRDSAGLCQRILKVWMSFVSRLDPKHLILHLPTVLSILIPFVSESNAFISPTLAIVMDNVKTQPCRHWPEVILLLQLAHNAPLNRIAGKLETRTRPRLSWHVADAVSPGGANLRSAPKRNGTEVIAEACEIVERIISKYENGMIEVLAVDHLVGLLRKNRRLLDRILKDLVKEHGKDNHRRIGILCTLLRTLVRAMGRTTNIRCQEKLMSCMGEVGALDPAVVSHIDISTAQRKQSGGIESRRPYPVAILKLRAFLLDNFLAPALALGEKRGGFKNQSNRLGLTIQEMLRITGCKREFASRVVTGNLGKGKNEGDVDWENGIGRLSEEEKAIFFWEHLKVSTRPVVQPYLEEIFNIELFKSVFGANPGDEQRACEPVWLKVRALNESGQVPSAEQWRRQMIVQLVDYCGEERIYGGTLRALRPVLRYQDNVTAYVFPLAVTTALDEQKRKKSTKILGFLAQELSLVLREGSSAQPVFDLLDTLRHWREQRCAIRGRLYRVRDAHGVGGGPAKPPSMQSNIESHRRTDPVAPLCDLDGGEHQAISLLAQAKSAFGARSYARAIMLAECHIRNMRQKRGFSKWSAFLRSLRGTEGQKESADGVAQLEAFRILQKSFAELEDAESMTGVATLRSHTSLTDVVIDAEAAGCYDEALVTYERAIAENPRSESLHSGFLACLMTLGHWETMLSHAEGLVSSACISEMGLRQNAQASGIDAAWRLKRWDRLLRFGYHSVDLDDKVACGSPWVLDFNLAFGRMLLGLRQRNLCVVKLAASEARQKLLSPVAMLAKEGYRRLYPVIVLLQTVSEVEDAMETIGKDHARCMGADRGRDNAIDGFPPLILLEGRTAATQESLRIREPLLTTRRVAFEILGMSSEAARASLELATLAHVGGNLRAASICAYQASKIAPSDEEVVNAAKIQMAKIRHQQGDLGEALLMVAREIERLMCVAIDTYGDCNPSSMPQRHAGRLAEGHVLAGKWIEEAGSESSDVIGIHFEKAVQFGPTREEPFYALGRHFDRLLQAHAGGGNTEVRRSKGRSSRSSGPDPSTKFLKFSYYIPLIIENFTKALCNGHSRLYDAMPRMLTVWFDYHSAADCPESKLVGGPAEASVKYGIKRAFDTIPSYMWMSAVPQLMSRLLHPRKLVREELTNFLARLTCIYPDQCAWLVWPASHLNNTERKKAVAVIINTAVTNLRNGKVRIESNGQETPQQQAQQLRIRMKTGLSILQGFVKICLKKLDSNKKARSYDFSDEFKGVKTTLGMDAMMNPMIPTLELLTVRMPSASGKNHRPFGAEPPRIADLENEALVMSSAMLPRRITLLGSDGQQYRYLAKQETSGDMRKDSRLVEFITVVNRLLSKDTLSQKRDIVLKTYAVLPLTEEAGMIEWVNHLTPMRALVNGHHRRLKVYPEMQEIHRMYKKCSNNLRRFHEWALDVFPPVLDKYFLENFGSWSDPHSWLEARNLWTQSVAVWSMAGYVVGLGDRHGENILLETTTGRCVHVDFAMLFDKGKRLRVPEVVPFRLTPNMVTAMGVAGYEGVFRAVAERVLGILRGNTEGLMGVLEAFLYDPLADWSTTKTTRTKDDSAFHVEMVTSKEAWQMKAAVKAKLGGIMDDTGLPLSVKGQVQRLIHEATSADNLCRMYIWWSGWV